MANFTRSDDLNAGTLVAIRYTPTALVDLHVAMALTDGNRLSVELTAAEVAAALTVPERTALRSSLDKLRAAAVTKAGGA